MKYILLGIVLGCSLLGFSQTISIKNKENDAPLEMVYIMSVNPSKSITTNKLGEADVAFMEGSEEIHIQRAGFNSITLSWSNLKAQKFEVYMSALNFNLDEIIVSASKWNQDASNVPHEVIRLGQKDNLFYHPQTSADMLSNSGMIFMQKSQQGGGSPMLRGFATNRLLYTVDGVRMNSAIFRSGNLQNVINVDPFTNENLEVIMGPGSTIYGSDAIGGVMSITTLTPQLSTKNDVLITGKAVARYSTANQEKTGHFDVNVGWKKFAFVTSASYWNFGDLQQGKNGPDDYVKPYFVERIDTMDVVKHQNNPLIQAKSGYQQFNLMQKLRYQPNKNWNIEYGFHYSQTTDYGRYDRLNRIKNDLPRYAEWNYGPQKWMLNNLSVTHSNSNIMYDAMTIRLAQQSFAESRHTRNFNDNFRENQLEQVDAYSGNIDFRKNIGKKNTLYYGVEYVLNQVNSHGTIEDIRFDTIADYISRYPSSNWQTVAAYINDEYRVNSKVTLQAGIRYSHFIINADFSNNQSFYNLPFDKAAINKGALSGSLGMVYKPNKTWRIRTLLGTAFRAPNIDDIGKIFDSEPGAVVVPNPNLNAEYAYNADIGVAKIFGNWGKFELNGFYTYLDNALVRRDFQLNGQDSIIYAGELSQVQAIQNASHAHLYGFVFSAEIKLPKGFGIEAKFNWQQGIEQLDDGSLSAARHAAPLFGNAKFNYTYKSLKLEFYCNYQGRISHERLPVGEQSKSEIYAKDENGKTYAPSWYTLNFKAMYTIKNQVNISFGIENITNQRYRPYSSGISGAGRNFIFSVSYQF